MKIIFILLMSVLPLYGTIEKQQRIAPNSNHFPPRPNGAHKKPSKKEIGFHFGVPLFWNAKAKTRNLTLYSKTINPFRQSQGYYLEGALCLPLIQWKLVGSYAYLKIELDPIKAPPLCPEKPFAQKIEYHSKEIALHRASFLASFIGLGKSMGVKWAQIEHASKALSTVKEKKGRYFKGAGPTLGVHLNWSFFDRICLTAKGNGALLIGMSRIKQQIKGVPFKGKYPTFAPNFLFLIGLDWNFLLGDVSWILGLDYKKEWVRKMKQPIKIKPQIKTSSSAPRIQDIDALIFDGIALHAGIKF